MMDTPDVNWYYGSKVLEPLCSKIGLPIDQVNFLSCQLVVLLAGYPYRTWLSPTRVSTLLRHLVQISIGFSLCLFCFGVQVIHYLMICLVCYVFMMVLKPGVMEKVVFVASMGYLAVMHIYRQIYDYGGYTLDITGPLMIAVQKLSSLAFSLRDGSVKDVSKLSENMKQKAVETFPNLVEFLSYMLCFHGLMCGPFCFYKDYIEFIDGSNYTKYEEPSQQSSQSNGSLERRERKAPSPKSACVSTFTQSIACGGIAAYFLPMFSVMFIKTAAFDALSFVPKMLYIVASTSLHRTKYYFAWKLGELVNANSGLGFNGYDKAGNSKWDLLCNADIYALETCTSLKIFLDKWNITTTHWLRYVVYERLHSTLAVFVFSAFWHGYYPGYYITFLGGAFFIHTGRLVRRTIRPWFVRNGPLLWLYHLLTYTATRLSTCYLVYPHVLLEFWPAIHSYRQIYFCLHIAAILITVVLTFVPKTRERKTDNAKKTE